MSGIGVFRGIGALIVVLACASMANLARADDAATARFHDARARAHYEARRFEEALAEFFLEERLAPNPRTIYNIALCFDRLHREDEAYLFYQEYQASNDESEERRTFVATALARLEPHVARLSVTSDPPGRRSTSTIVIAAATASRRACSRCRRASTRSPSRWTATARPRAR